MEVDAPFIAKKALAGQFIILRVDEKGERIPLTISDYDREKGTITIIFQIVGQTTMLLSQLKEGDALLDFVGPLGKATDFEGAKKVCVIGGGVGNAIAYPSAKQLFNEGVEVDVIAGFRNKDIVIAEDANSKAAQTSISRQMTAHTAKRALLQTSSRALLTQATSTISLLR